MFSVLVHTPGPESGKTHPAQDDLPFVMLISDVGSNAEQEWFGSYEHALSFANVPPGLRPISGSDHCDCDVRRLCIAALERVSYLPAS